MHRFGSIVRCNNNGLTKDNCEDCGNDNSKCSSEDCHLKKRFLIKRCVETGMFLALRIVNHFITVLSPKTLNTITYLSIFS